MRQRLPIGRLDWPLVGLVGLALALHWGLILGRGFDGLYGQDAFGYYTYARQVGESLQQGRLPPPYYWPLGYPALLAAGFGLVGPTPVVGQLVSSLAGAAVVVLTVWLGRDLLAGQGVAPATARGVGLVAGLLTATAGALWQWSTTVMADTTALAWATLAAWALARYGCGGRWPWLALAAAGLAGATATRWLYAVLVPLVGLVWAVEAGRRRWALGHLALAGLVGLAVLAPQVAVSAAHPGLQLGHPWLTGWSPLNAVRREFVTVDGTASYLLPVGLFVLSAAASPRLLGPLMIPAVLVGLGVVLRRGWWRVAALLGGWGVAIAGFLSGIPYQNPRFMLALLPVLAILAVLGVAQVWAWLRPRWRPVLVGYLLVGLLVGLVASARLLDGFVAQKEADQAVAGWAAAQVPPDARLLAFELTLTLRHYTPLAVEELFGLTPTDLDRLLADGRPTYLLARPATVAGQWAGQPPELAFRWLRERPGLTVIGHRHDYTPYRVTPWPRPATRPAAPGQPHCRAEPCATGPPVR